MGAGAAGAGGSATTFFSTIAPSQPGAAVAGVQEEFLQHSPEAFFQTSLEELRQLLITCAEAAEANVTAANKTAKRLNLFMMLLGELVAIQKESGLWTGHLSTGQLCHTNFFTQSWK